MTLLRGAPRPTPDHLRLRLRLHRGRGRAHANAAAAAAHRRAPSTSMVRLPRHRTKVLHRRPRTAATSLPVRPIAGRNPPTRAGGDTLTRNRSHRARRATHPPCATRPPCVTRPTCARPRPSRPSRHHRRRRRCRARTPPQTGRRACGRAWASRITRRTLARRRMQALHTRHPSRLAWVVLPACLACRTPRSPITRR